MVFDKSCREFDLGGFVDGPIFLPANDLGEATAKAMDSHRKFL